MANKVVFWLNVVALGSAAALTMTSLTARAHERPMAVAAVAAVDDLGCHCTMSGSGDDMAWDVQLGEAKATAGKTETLIIPARSICGPLQLRAWMGMEAP